jgi:hypothetical protein
LTEDRCDGTLTRVMTGTVRVRDFGRHRTVTVHAGKTYLACAVTRAADEGCTSASPGSHR